jgi:DNA-directed RNA polymerase beta subunit
MRIEVQQSADETGELEEFTWDLFPLVDASETTHLDESGLPKIGTRIRAGMIIVGKIAKTRSYDPERQPTAIEIQGLDRQTLCSKYGGMWRDTSLYADEAQLGVVKGASFVQRGGSTVAVILIEKDVSPPENRTGGSEFMDPLR